MDKHDWKRIGARIQDVRIQRKISRKEMQALTGLDESTICNIEHGRTHPSLESLLRLVDVLDISLDYIIYGIRPLHSADGLVFRSDDELEETYLLTEG